MKILDYLSAAEVDFEVKHHEECFTAQEEAAAGHIPGHMFAKTVVVRADGQHVLLVLPASHRVDLDRIEDHLGQRPTIVREGEMAELFPDCEVGAEPPFGSQYGLRTIVDTHLTKQERIAVRACSHREVVLLSYEDYARLEEPEVLSFAVLES
ncbi:MAG: aminoacyl-tRNA deacylase [Armatimonadota bacterium]|jgi:Ala-tRNA(Pro) deacylase